LATVNTDQGTTIANGRYLRSKRRYQNKAKRHFQRKLSSKTKGSRRWKSINGAKRRVCRNLNNQIKDITHKQTTIIVRTLEKEGVGTVGIGDMRNIRQGTNYGRHSNQRIHQMLSGQTRHMITYKAERLGMSVVLVDESYSSQTCPRCLVRNKPASRQYICHSCGFVYHRDGVGAINIRSKTMYTGYAPVVGDMAPPVGIRYPRTSAV
jgi:putative transposase